jgi:hypothetical protein
MLTKAELFIKNLIDEAGGLPDIEEAVSLLLDYTEGTYYESKNKRLNAGFFRGDVNLEELVIAVFTLAIDRKIMTYQAACGLLKYKIDLEDEIDQIKTIAEVIGIISKTNLINVGKKGKYIKITPGYEINVTIPKDDPHAVKYTKPEKAITNYLNGRSLIGGSKFNKHDGNINLTHINTLNAIALSVNTEFLSAYEETTDKLDKPKNNESITDFKFRKEQFRIFVEERQNRHNEIIRNGNKFYMEGHFYDGRGRGYARGYFVTTQGNEYEKAVIQLHQKELVTK